MIKRLNFTLPFNKDLQSYLKKNHKEVVDYRIISKSLDARGAPKGTIPKYHYSLELMDDNADLFNSHQEHFSPKNNPNNNTDRPVIIGAGPAGLFAALRLMEYGVKSIILERGESVDRRMLDIAKFWRYGDFNSESNVCYGEGGAGLFSDGKLLTRVKSPHIKYVMKKLVEFGAPKETEFISNPHLGSNKIRKVIAKISQFLKEKGTEIRCNTKVEQLLFDKDKVTGVIVSSDSGDGKEILSENVILAVGHSAKDIYQHLHQNKVAMESKDFAVGVRVEHPRQYLDTIQYGKFAGDSLGAARYRLSWNDKKSERGVYSFCMCPGGYVLSSGTEADGIVVNGMSNFARNSKWSNAAIVVSVKKGIDFKADNVLSAIAFQRDMESKAFQLSKEYASGKELPALGLTEFLNGKIDPAKKLQISSPSGVVKAPIEKIFPDFVTDHLKRAFNEFDRKIKGFKTDLATVIAPETRTSAPLTISRVKETMQSTSHKGLYPCGEGAGYAGGITSAAVDGIKAAEAIISL